MQQRMRLPRWMLSAEAGQASDPGTARRMLRPPEVAVFQKAATVPGTRLPDAFGHLRAASAAIDLIQGGPSWHLVSNFAHAGWTEHGTVAQLTTPEGAALRRYLKTAEPCQLDGHVFQGVVEGSAIYTHWLLDTLPRLLLLAEAGLGLEAFDTFLFATIATPFHRFTLEALGIPLEKVRTRQLLGPYFRAEAFTHVSAPRQSFVAAPGIYAMVYDFLAGPAPTEKPSRRIYITRRGAGRRRILNEDEVEAVLLARGFETVAFEALNLRQTAEAMAGASHIVAPHGAGLANLVFAPPGTKVLELFNAHLSPEYWRICGQRGLEYHAMEAFGPDRRPLDPARRDAMDFITRNGLDLWVDPRALGSYLDAQFL